MKKRLRKKADKIIPYHEIDIELIPLIKEMSKLSFLCTDFCCAGYGEGQKKDIFDRMDHNYCGAAYISIQYTDDVRSKLFHEQLMDLNIFDKTTFTNIYGGIGYYIHYRAQNCMTNTISKLQCDICNGSGKDSYLCRQDELAERWRQVLNFVKQWNGKNEFSNSL